MIVVFCGAIGNREKRPGAFLDVGVSVIHSSRATIGKNDRTMLAEERRAKILETVNERGSVSVTDLHRKLRVSRETIRRDITKLSDDGVLRRTHGGALALNHSEPLFEERASLNVDGKRLIGQVAASMVADDTSLFIDSGTTTSFLAEALEVRRRLTVYTNDLRTAARLAGRNDNRVILTGGEYLAAEGALVGADAVATFSNYFPDFAFVGCSAVSVQPSLMDYTREGADMRAKMLEQARTKVVLADHTKFEQTAPVRIPGLDEVDVLITDIRPSARMAKAFGSIPAEIVVAAEADLDDA